MTRRRKILIPRLEPLEDRPMQDLMPTTFGPAPPAGVGFADPPGPSFAPPSQGGTLPGAVSAFGDTSQPVEEPDGWPGIGSEGYWGTDEVMDVPDSSPTTVEDGEGLA